MDYGKHYSGLATPQKEPIPGREEEMVKNNAGGYTFPVSNIERLRRFLILGTEGGSYYVNERELTIDNAKTIKKMVESDGAKVVEEVVAVSMAGKAPNNDAALFVLAMCAASKNKETRRLALQNLHKVARIGTHLFHFCKFVKGFRGGGRLLKYALQN